MTNLRATLHFLAGMFFFYFALHHHPAGIAKVFSLAAAYLIMLASAIVLLTPVTPKKG